MKGGDSFRGETRPRAFSRRRRRLFLERRDGEHKTARVVSRVARGVVPAVEELKSEGHHEFESEYTYEGRYE